MYYESINKKQVLRVVGMLEWIADIVISIIPYIIICHVCVDI